MSASAGGNQPFKIDPAKPPYTLVVVGGQHYGESDAGWLTTRFLTLTERLRRVHQLHVRMPRSAGAAEIVAALCERDRTPHTVLRAWPEYGAEESVRQAMELMPHAQGVLAFDPPGECGAWVLRLAAMVPGVAVRTVGRR